MPGIHDFGLFLAAGALLNMTPGQDTFYIIGRTLSQGRRAGVASVLGICAGSLGHTLLAATGLSALLAASSSAFLVVKWLGAGYLCYLGIRMLLVRPVDGVQGRALPPASFGTVFRQGMLTNILNPKVALFFLAFMPQFIAVSSDNKFLAFVLLGCTFVTTGTIWCFCLVWFASHVGERLRGSGKIATAINRGAGALFIALGLRLAVTP
jgi:threonine/homoserine/homoserine lactone efflux protein